MAEGLRDDPTHGQNGVGVMIELEVGDDDGDLADDVFATKYLAVQPQLPADREPNHNPVVRALQIDTPEGVFTPFPSMCVGNLQLPLQLEPGDSLELVPLERPDTYDHYPVRTSDGTFVQVKETIKYQWLATAGTFDRAFTGGTDGLGLGSTWRVPEFEGSLEVQLWMIQRDDRGGVAVFPTCIDAFR